MESISNRTPALRDANKLVRDVFQGRHIGLKYQQLEVSSLEDVVFVAWAADAAVGNRRDLSSSGGYVIGACDPKILKDLLVK